MSATGLTNEVYRKIYTELISAIKGDSTFQRELTKDQFDFIEQNWHKKMDEANLHIKQCQEIPSMLLANRISFSYPGRSLTAGSLAQPVIQSINQSDTFYGGSFTQTKQNSLIKHFGTERVSINNAEPLNGSRGMKSKFQGVKKIKETPKPDSDSDVFEDAQSIDRSEPVLPEVGTLGQSEKQTIDINLNLTAGSGSLHKREAIKEESDDSAIFVR